MDRMAEGMESPESIILRSVAMAKNHARCPQAGREDPLLDDSIADGARGAISGSGDDLAGRTEPEFFGHIGLKGPGDLLGLINASKDRWVDVELG
jgi:hypothetical protein